MMRWALAALDVMKILRDRRWAADMGALAALEMVDVPQNRDIVEVEDVGVVQTQMWMGWWPRNVVSMVCVKHGGSSLPLLSVRLPRIIGFPCRLCPRHVMGRLICNCRGSGG